MDAGTCARIRARQASAGGGWTARTCGGRSAHGPAARPPAPADGRCRGSVVCGPAACANEVESVQGGASEREGGTVLKEMLENQDWEGQSRRRCSIRWILVLSFHVIILFDSFCVQCFKEQVRKFLVRANCVPEPRSQNFHLPFSMTQKVHLLNEGAISGARTQRI